MAAFDAVTQRRHHAIRFERGFGPLPSGRWSYPHRGLSSVASPAGNIGRLLQRSKLLASNFLPPFPSERFCFPPLSPFCEQTGSVL